jgi:hypothetical protein
VTAPAESQVFMTSEEAANTGKVFGHRYNGRYHLPVLDGESGIKSLPKGARPWVPRGVQSATNLAGAISESRALGIWERERSQLGLALRPDLYERMVFVVRRAHHVDGINFAVDKLKNSAAGLKLKEELEAIHDEARQACGANAAGIEGTNRHDVWEMRSTTGQLFGTPGINGQIEALEELLERKRLRRLPGMQERVVRNVALNAAGRFDDVLQDMATGELLMADLKTKRSPFFSMLELRIQFAVYATAEWMLQGEGAAAQYVPGPKHHVSQRWGVMLHLPADSSAPPVLKRVNLEAGYRAAELARQVCEERSEGKSVGTFAESEWPDA